MLLLRSSCSDFLAICIRNYIQTQAADAMVGSMEPNNGFGLGRAPDNARPVTVDSTRDRPPSRQPGGRGGAATPVAVVGAGFGEGGLADRVSARGYHGRALFDHRKTTPWFSQRSVRRKLIFDGYPKLAAREIRSFSSFNVNDALLKDHVLR